MKYWPHTIQNTEIVNDLHQPNFVHERPMENDVHIIHVERILFILNYRRQYLEVDGNSCVSVSMSVNCTAWPPLLVLNTSPWGFTQPLGEDASSHQRSNAPSNIRRHVRLWQYFQWWLTKNMGYSILRTAMRAVPSVPTGGENFSYRTMSW